MQRKRFHTSISAALAAAMCLCAAPARAQNPHPSFTINSTTINGGDLLSDNWCFTDACLVGLSVLPTININGSGDLSGTAGTVTLNKFMARLAGTSSSGVSVTALASNSNEITLSTAPTNLVSALLSITLLNQKDVTIRFRLPQSQITGTAWVAGTYTTGLTFTAPGGALCLGSQSFSGDLTLTVSPFISVPAVSNITLNVNSFSFYRNTGGINTSQSITVTATVPHNIRLKTTASGGNFTYTPLPANSGQSLSSSVSKVSVQSTSATITPSTTFQNLLSAAVSPPAGNHTTSPFTYSISKANLLSDFKYAGSYVAPLNYEVFQTTTPVTATTQSLSPTLTVNVSDMGEISVNNSNVTLSFRNATDYITGRDTSIANHVTVSQTTPYDVSVRAYATNLSNGTTTIPASIFRIGPANAGSGILQTGDLSTTTQKIVNGGTPVVDRSLDIKYTIPASKVPNILGKPAGDYSTTIEYSLTAH